LQFGNFAKTESGYDPKFWGAAYWVRITVKRKSSMENVSFSADDSAYPACMEWLPSVWLDIPVWPVQAQRPG
jgi:hypothetical protein